MSTDPTILNATDAQCCIADTPTLRVLDVRTPGEFETHRIPGAHNVPLDTVGTLAPDLIRLGAPLLLVCQSGQRARQACQLLSAAGVPQLMILDGGLAEWTAAGKEVARGRKRVSLERQVRIVAGALAATGGFLALAINPWFAIVPALVGTGLVYAGVSDTCMMGTVLGKLPYNRMGQDATAVRRALLAHRQAA